ncbi:hypothetical protein MVEN_00112100 [Mycena venus]|uniref:LysM domain-containing protein n=1 Tax=Mycena venus TaxID=2733690 RepID=A0A8H6Z837_9AGAR|nr:hypothetical protein MVEN_00112100 [Mycena venus]
MFSKAFSALLVTALAVSASPFAPLEARQGCAQTYTVASGDTCAAIESRAGVSDAQLHALNPSINGGCTNLQIGQVLCLSSGGGSPPSGGCRQTYTVVSGDTCAAIESRTGVSDSQLHALNPSINGGCTKLQIGQVLCLGGGGVSPPCGGQSFNGLGLVHAVAFCRTGISLSHLERDTGMVAPIADIRLIFSVSVQDLCPGCQGANGIDLSEGAMAALDSNYINDGVISVVWSFA